jgi:hypothetical protein
MESGAPHDHRRKSQLTPHRKGHEGFQTLMLSLNANNADVSVTPFTATMCEIHTAADRQRLFRTAVI